MARKKVITDTTTPAKDTAKINAEATKSPVAEVSVKTETVKEDFMNPPEVKEATQEEPKDTVKEKVTSEKVPAKKDAKTPAEKTTARKRPLGNLKLLFAARQTQPRHLRF